jgi:hypothetical protein
MVCTLQYSVFIVLNKIEKKLRASPSLKNAKNNKRQSMRIPPQVTNPSYVCPTFPAEPHRSNDRRYGGVFSEVVEAVEAAEEMATAREGKRDETAVPVVNMGLGFKVYGRESAGVADTPTCFRSQPYPQD